MPNCTWQVSESVANESIQISKGFLLQYIDKFNTQLGQLLPSFMSSSSDFSWGYYAAVFLYNG